MTRLYALLTSSHFAAWASGGFSMLAIANAAHGQWDGVVLCGTGAVLTLLLMRHFKRTESSRE